MKQYYILLGAAGDYGDGAYSSSVYNSDGTTTTPTTTTSTGATTNTTSGGVLANTGADVLVPLVVAAVLMATSIVVFAGRFRKKPTTSDISKQ